MRFILRGAKHVTISVSNDSTTWEAVDTNFLLPNAIGQGCNVEVFDIPVGKVARYARVDLHDYYSNGAGLNYFGQRAICKPSVT